MTDLYKRVTVLSLQGPIHSSDQLHTKLPNHALRNVVTVIIIIKKKLTKHL